jgi:hypothetical protein
MRISRLLRSSRRGPEAVAADVDDEIRSHLEERVRLLAAQGMPADAARAEAMRRFGDLETTRRAMRSSAERHEARRRWGDRLDAARHDLRYALR